jgi:hypothetical protein
MEPIEVTLIRAQKIKERRDLEMKALYNFAIKKRELMIEEASLDTNAYISRLRIKWALWRVDKKYRREMRAIERKYDGLVASTIKDLFGCTI